MGGFTRKWICLHQWRF